MVGFALTCGVCLSERVGMFGRLHMASMASTRAQGVTEGQWAGLRTIWLGLTFLEDGLLRGSGVGPGRGRLIGFSRGTRPGEFDRFPGL